MEAKDTVMSDEQMFRVLEHEANSGLMALLKAQAEISYKAGYKKASDESNAISHLDCYEDGKKAGMKKVVEWVKANKSCRSDFMTPGEFYFRIDENEWQAFCKEIET